MSNESLPYVVVYLRSGTDSEAAEPTRYATWREAADAAIIYNRCNQDRTWNAIVAHVIGVRNP